MVCVLDPASALSATTSLLHLGAGGAPRLCFRSDYWLLLAGNQFPRCDVVPPTHGGTAPARGITPVDTPVRTRVGRGVAEKKQTGRVPDVVGALPLVGGLVRGADGQVQWAQDL